jgi:hypothetical protein
LTDYPVYFNLADVPSGHLFWSNVQADGDDIRVTTDDGTTQVPCEVVAIDTTGKTGEVHFLADGTLSSSADTKFYVYCGNASATAPAADSTYGSEAVWADYVFVYHLEENSGSTAVDASGNFDGTYSSGATDAVAVQIENGQQFTGDGSDEVTGAGTTASFTSLSMSCWLLATTDYVSGIDDLYVGSGIILERGNFGILRFRHEDLSDGFYGMNIGADIADGLIMVHSTWDGSNKYAYENGIQTATEAATGTIVPGTWGNNEIGEGWPGKLDELRLRADYLSADWVDAEHTNQASSSSFYTIGPYDPQDSDTSSFSNFVDIVIQHEAMYSDETQIPVLIDLDQLSASHAFWSTIQVDGDDIRFFVGPDECHMELVDIDTGAETGEIWISIDSDDDTDVIVKMYYGNATLGAYASPASVWHNWSFVYHMENMADRSLNEWDLTANGGLPDPQAGQVGLAQDHDGSGDYGINSSVTHNLNSFSIMFWAYRATGASGYDTIISGDNSWRMQYTTNGSKPSFGQRQDGQSNQEKLANTAWTVDTWEHRAFKRDGDNYTFFYNGATDGTGTITIEQPYTEIEVGRNTAYGGGDDWYGRLDEIFLYNGILSDGAVNTMYASMGTPGTFAEYGAHSSGGGTGIQIIIIH